MISPGDGELLAVLLNCTVRQAGFQAQFIPFVTLDAIRSAEVAGLTALPKHRRLAPIPQKVPPENYSTQRCPFGAIMVNRKAPLLTRPRFHQGLAGIWDQQVYRRWIMTFVPIMWSVWGVFVALMLSLHIYRGSLEKNEDDQIFLDDSFEHEKAAQLAIVAKVHKVEPVLRVAKWLALAMTIVIIVYYIRDILMQLDVMH
jgi:hypothetical protein